MGGKKSCGLSTLIQTGLILNIYALKCFSVYIFWGFVFRKLGKTNNLKSKYEETKTQMFEDQDAEMQEISNEYEGLLSKILY